MQRAVLFACFVLVSLVGCKKSETQTSTPGSASGVTGSAAVAVALDAAAAAVESGSGSGSAGSAAAGSAGSAADGDDPWTDKAAAKSDPIAKPFLWSIEKDGKTSFVLGTIHIGVDAEQKLPKLVFDKLDAAKTFAMETDTSDPSLANMGARTSGTLRQDLGPVYWKKLEDVVGANVASAIDKMKPMIAATLVSLKGLPTTPPMDGVLHGRATRLGKKIEFLESAASQAAVLEKHMTVKALKMMLDDPKRVVDETMKMHAAYLAGDEAKFVELTAVQRADAIKAGYTEAEYDEFMEDINYKRNAAWVPKIEKLVADGPAFIAVGALHLVGPRSVLDLLQKRGYQVTRLAP